MRALALAAFGALAALATGCGTSVVERDDLEREVQERLTATVGQQAPKPSCPDELKVEAGASTRCTMTFPDGRLGVTVKVVSVDGANAKLDIQADERLQR